MHLRLINGLLKLKKERKEENEVLLHALSCTDLGNINLREKSLSPKPISCMIPFM